MALIIPIRGFCPHCRRIIRLSTIEPHPVRDDVAIHTFTCAACGPTMIIVEDQGREYCEIIRGADYERALAVVSQIMAAG